MILVVSTPADEHTQVVLRELSALGAETYLCDLSRFPRDMTLVMRYERAARPEFTLHDTEGRAVRVDRVRAVWWRRPQSYSPDDSITRRSHRNFALSESHEAFAGLWQALDVFWINHPTRDEVAARKAYQLRVAADVGLEVPTTLITNDPAEARKFVDSHGIGRVAYKAFSATAEEWRETRLVRQEELGLLNEVRHAPVIFQEYISGDVDIRATVIGNEIFPAAIHSQETAYPIDCRMDLGNARVEPTSLPDNVSDGLRNLVDKLGLVYAAIDMRRTPDGRYVFLEVNPSGQWLFIENLTGQRMSAALAAALAGADRHPA